METEIEVHEGYFLVSSVFLADLMKLPYGSEITGISPDKGSDTSVLRVYVRHPTMPKVYGDDPDEVHCICEKIACHFEPIKQT